VSRLTRSICSRLGIGDPAFVEIESKWRVLPDEARRLRKHLLERKGLRHRKRAAFFDQFLDTPRRDLLRLGASLRLRYKGDGSRVYLQYKGPGFRRDRLLYRSEFSSERLKGAVREESHHDIIHFTDTRLSEILERHASPEMADAMRRHLGIRVLSAISMGPVVCSYQKEKFDLDLGGARLEPSLDRVFAFHISRDGLHALSSFWEYENEIKSEKAGLEAKLEHVKDLQRFDRRLAKRFRLREVWGAY